MTTFARDRLAAFKKTQPRTPRLTRTTVQARGLSFALYTSPAMPGNSPLLCVNGGMLYSHALLWPALAPLAAQRQLILYDQRGRGASPAPPGARRSRIEFDAGDVPAIREALGIDRWDVLGHSWGAGIAELAAERDPAGTRRLVLVGVIGPTSDWVKSLHADALGRLDGREHQTLASLDPAALHVDDPAIHGEYSRALYPSYFADRSLARTLAPPREESATGAAVAARLRREGYDWRALLARVAATTLVVHGDQDVIPMRLARETAALIPRARLEVIKGAGHMPFLEQPAEFFNMVGTFLDEPDRGA